MFLSFFKTFFYCFFIIMLFDSCKKDCDCTPIILGCTDVLALNYNPDATNDDGNCIPLIEGCLDPLASNFAVPSGNIFTDVNTNNQDMCEYSITALIGSWFLNDNLTDCSSQFANSQANVIEGDLQDEVVFQSFWSTGEDLIGTVSGNDILFDDYQIDITIAQITVNISGIINKAGDQMTLNLSTDDTILGQPIPGLPCSYVYNKELPDSQ